MARLRQQGLRRTVGVPGMFGTAYGNVGSSIYYALGLVASHALGLTPLVFIFAGGLFALTAKTYAEGAAMFPEAGGSSSFARHAFNEVASFFAGWALTLDYIITIAISAFFVPHYLGAFFPALRHPPEMVTYLGERNIAIFSTDMDSFDFKLKKPDQVVTSVMTKLKKFGKGIVLMHDFQHATADAAPALLAQLKANGYKIVQLTAKGQVQTIASYDELVTKDQKLPTVSDRPTSSVVRTISE